MSKAVFNKASASILAKCPDCSGATTSFAYLNAQTTVMGNHQFQGQTYSRIVYGLYCCGVCGRGALAEMHDKGGPDSAVIGSFFPYSRDTAPLPDGVPVEIIKEYREAELCGSVGARRAASALLRSVLEKTLNANGYSKGRLVDKIDQAAADGVITEARRRRAHDEVRVLGNDVLHDDWREITAAEVEAAHHYTQRILEDFYDNRSEVEKVLIAKKRISEPAAATSP